MLPRIEHLAVDAVPKAVREGPAALPWPQRSKPHALHSPLCLTSSFHVPPPTGTYSAPLYSRRGQPTGGVLEQIATWDLAGNRDDLASFVRRRRTRGSLAGPWAALGLSRAGYRLVFCNYLAYIGYT